MLGNTAFGSAAFASYVTQISLCPKRHRAGDCSRVIYPQWSMQRLRLTDLTFSGQSIFKNVKTLHLSTDVQIQEVSDVRLWKR